MLWTRVGLAFGPASLTRCVPHVVRRRGERNPRARSECCQMRYRGATKALERDSSSRRAFSPAALATPQQHEHVRTRPKHVRQHAVSPSRENAPPRCDSVQRPCRGRPLPLRIAAPRSPWSQPRSEHIPPVRAWHHREFAVEDAPGDVRQAAAICRCRRGPHGWPTQPCGIRGTARRLMRPAGIEPATSRSGGARSIP